MTKLERIFDIYEVYHSQQINNSIQEGRIYLRNGAEDFSKKVRGIDVDESIVFLNQLDKLFTSLPTHGDKKYILSSGKMSFCLELLRENFSEKLLREYAVDLKILASNLRTVLNAENVRIYQDLADFFDLLLLSWKVCRKNKFFRIDLRPGCLLKKEARPLFSIFNPSPYRNHFF